MIKRVPADKYFNKKVFPYTYFIRDNGLLHNVVKDDDKLFHALVVTIAFSKYIYASQHMIY